MQQIDYPQGVKHPSYWVQGAIIQSQREKEAVYSNVQADIEDVCDWAREIANFEIEQINDDASEPIFKITGVDFEVILKVYPY